MNDNDHFIKLRNRLVGHVIRTYRFSKNDAEDVIQEAFLRVEITKNRSAHEKKFEYAYYVRAVYTAVVRLIDQRQRTVRIAAVDVEEVVGLEAGLDASGGAQLNELIADYNDCLDRLKPDYKDAFYLRTLGHKFREIGTALRCPAATADTWNYRGRQQIRECMKMKGHSIQGEGDDR